MTDSNSDVAYIVLELAAPIQVTMLSGEVFESSKYRLGTAFIHASGYWKGGGTASEMVLIPISSIDHIAFTSRQVTPEEVPKDHQVSVNIQVDNLKPTGSMGAARG